ncbi:hypothetical protein NPIL_584731 [Nephila pilipes]|uniref:Peptidase A2 domain-containing protein n=1 Tax=Nephila pilipes TaxID=299642 RepID=A0A8X6NWF8_NEPPI|nr:hypothetical protein NPIL_584731 [Nephila pilipes]
MQRLPFNVQVILYASMETFTQLAQLAVKICEVESDSQSIVCAISNSKKDQSNDVLTVLTKPIEALTVQVELLTHERHRQSFSYKSNSSRSKSRKFTPKHNENPSYCFYHNIFQKKGRQCVPLCNLISENLVLLLFRKQFLGRGMTAKNSNLLYVFDALTNMKFLVDTGSDVSCIPQHKDKRINNSHILELIAANNTRVKTYGIKSIDLSFGLKKI